MKETLGVRPIYHQTAERSAAHLFITVLAYHLLATKLLLTRAGESRTWGTLRDVLSTLTRNTVMMQNEEGSTYHIRLIGQSEAEHQDIFDKIGAMPTLKANVSKIE